MTTPKNNAHILAEPEAFMATYDRAREAFGKIAGVLGVGFGQKQTAGEFTDKVAIVVFVAQKKDEAELAAGERLPETFEGYPVDVRTPIPLTPAICDNETSYDTIRGGIQISVGTGAGVGTLSCIVRRRGDSGRENVYLLTNRHVLTTGGAGEDDYVYHPFVSAQGPGGPQPSTSLGPTQRGIFFNNLPATVRDPQRHTFTDTFFVDCGIARIDIDSKCFGSTCTRDTTRYAAGEVIDLALNGSNVLSDVRDIARDPSIVVPTSAPAGTGPFVYKVGRTTGKTRGIVRAVNAVSNVSALPVANTPAIIAQNVIEISFDTTSEPTGLNCKGRAWFAQSGDSGSLLVDGSNKVIGLISLVPDPNAPGTPANATSAACHIVPVLDRLGICIPTPGTSHGSCSATDGSGLVAVAIGDEDSSSGSGIAFAAQAGHGLLEDPPAAPLSEGEQERLFALRDALRGSAKGRELHDSFAEVRREIGYLVRNCRPVKVAWHRGQGPAFFAHVLNHLRGGTDAVPLTVNGVPREAMLARMAAVLATHGSKPLRAAIERHRDNLMTILAETRTVEAWLAMLRDAEGNPPIAERSSVRR